MIALTSGLSPQYSNIMVAHERYSTNQLVFEQRNSPFVFKDNVRLSQNILYQTPTALKLLTTILSSTSVRFLLVMSPPKTSRY